MLGVECALQQQQVVPIEPVENMIEIAPGILVPNHDAAGSYDSALWGDIDENDMIELYDVNEKQGLLMPYVYDEGKILIIFDKF